MDIPGGENPLDDHDSWRGLFNGKEIVINRDRIQDGVVNSIDKLFTVTIWLKLYINWIDDNITDVNVVIFVMIVKAEDVNMFRLKEKRVISGMVVTFGVS